MRRAIAAHAANSLKAWDGAVAAPNFAWVREPVLNPYTRLAVAMCPAEGLLRVDRLTTGPEALLPEPVTGICEITLTSAPKAA